MPVFGTTKPLLKSHYVASGFDARFDGTLVAAAAVPSANQRMLAARRLALQETRDAAVARV